MAVANPIGAEVAQWLQDGRNLSERSKQLTLELKNHIKRGDELIYERSPLTSRINFLLNIPLEMCNLVSNIGKAGIGLVALLFCCGDIRGKQTLFHALDDIKCNVNHIRIFAYGLFFPVTAIEMEYQSPVRRLF